MDEKEKDEIDRERQEPEMPFEAEKEALTSTSSDEKNGSFFFSAIHWLALYISILVWAVVGLVIYIPMLFRIMAYYSSMVVVSAFQEVDLRPVHNRVEFVIRLYPDRFRAILDSFREKEYKLNNQVINAPPINWVELLKRAWVDIVWGAFFWLVPIALIFPDVTAFLTRALSDVLIWLLIGVTIIFSLWLLRN